MSLNRCVLEIYWSGCNLGADLSRISLVQDWCFGVYVNDADRVGNGYAGSAVVNHKTLFFSVDQAPPVVTIANPVSDSVMYWNKPDVISFTGKYHNSSHMEQ